MLREKKLIKNVFYNIYGTFFYFFCQWLITVLIVRISGYEDAGILSLIISTTNLFYCLATFGVRNFQVTDVLNEYTDNNYINLRIFTVTIAILLFLISLCFFGFDKKTLYCSLVYIVYKCGEAFSDVFFGSFQRYSCYRNIAVSSTLKGILTLSTFVLTLMLTHNLFLTLGVNVIVYYMVLILYDMMHLNKYFKIEFKRFDVIPILKKCFPLMLYVCMVPYLNFITRFVVEKNYGTEILGYYSSVTMVFVVLSTIMQSIFVSIIPRIATLYIEDEYESIKKLLMKLIFIIIFIALAGCFVAFFAGDFIFSIIFGKQILRYMYLLIPTIIASIALTYTSLFSSILISFKENNLVILCNLVSIVICTISIFVLLINFELLGVVYSLIISLFISACLLFTNIIKKLK